MKLGLWRLQYLYRALRLHGPVEGYNIIWRKEVNHLFTLEQAARAGLPPLTAPAGTAPASTVYLMTGERHSAMALFCAYSLYQVTPHPLRVVIQDDGTLGQATRARFKACMPQLEFCDASESQAGAEAFLPPSRFPNLWKARQRLILMRKLMDVHAPSPGWKLFLDSDMAFIRKPAAMLDWLWRPQLPCCMVDVMVSYGYPETRMAELAGGTVPEFVNTGICGLERGQLDWEKLDFWAGRLMEEYGVNHFLEQALTAMVFATKPFLFMPRRDYICCPLREQVWPDATGVMHHYVSESRTHYLLYGWQRVRDIAVGKRKPAS